MNQKKKHSKRCSKYTSSKQQETLPLADAYYNFQLAKKLFKENLEHEPLPDTVSNAIYRKLQMERAAHPGAGLDEKPVVTGVGWKEHGVANPTQCTKMKVYRPKTAGEKGKGHRLQETRQRPSSSMPRLIQKHTTPIELAICWDVIPEDPNDEPKRTPHIDGSNGSAAPAVFALVHSPKPPDNVPPSSSSSKSGTRSNSAKNSVCNGVNGCGSEQGSIKKGCTGPNGCNTPPLVQKSTNNAGNLGNRVSSQIQNMKISNKNSNCSKNSSHGSNVSDRRRNSITDLKPQPKQRDSIDTVQTFNSNELTRRKTHRSSPNLAENCDKTNSSCGSSCQKNIANNLRRPCIACELKSSHLDKRPKSEYKMAFKAGNPQSQTSFDSTQSGPTKFPFRVPKQREPYAKRNYAIGTLAPPFSLWPGHRGHDYPEHWRLASVYQHAYKPVMMRKKPLISTVYQ